MGEASQAVNALWSRRVLLAYGVWMTALLTAHYALPGLLPEISGLVALSGVAAIFAGVACNRPSRPAPWLLIAAANLTGTAGALSLHIQELVSNAAPPFPSVSDAIFLCTYPLYVAGLGLFIRYRTNERDRRSVIDTLILTVGLGLLSWFFLVRPDATDPSLSWLQKFTASAYPIGDLLILTTIARLLTPGTARGWPIRLITFGTAGALASGVAYDLSQINGHYHEGSLLGIGWLFCFAAWGAAALHPAMRDLTEWAGYRPPDASLAWVLALTIATLIVPVFQFIEAFPANNGGVEGELAVVCAVLFLLVLSRLWDVVVSHRRGIARERTLRMAGASLASATSIHEIADTVRYTAAALLGRPEPGPRAGAAAVLAVRSDGRLRSVVTDPHRLPGGDQLRELLEDLLPSLNHPKFIQAEEFGGVRPGGVALASGEGILVCPLVLKDRPDGDPHIGVLAVYGPPRELVARAAPLEIVASQAALAVERVTLSQQVVRQRGEALFRTLVQDASDVILIVDDEGKVRYATPSAVDIFGDIAVEGKSVTDLVGQHARDDIARVLDLIVAGVPDGGLSGFLVPIENLDGRAVVIEIRSSDLRDDPTVGGLVLTLRDVTAQRQLEEELKHRAFHDDLTGLPNRALFAERASEAISEAHRTGRVVGVLFVDLDDFKVVNDTMGHSVGDDLLVAMAARLAASIRQSDLAARLGGDEFALLIDNAADSAAVESFGERIVGAFTEPVTLTDPDSMTEVNVPAAVSVGIATSQDSADADELLRHADLALYAAKAAGKRRWRRYQPALSAGMLRRREIQAALDDAVARSQFTLAYQPIVALNSGEIAGFEALVRWPHPQWGMILPSEFITLAEETGHIVPLGAWVLRQALTDMAGWRRRLGVTGGAVPHVSVNVSARQIRDRGFVDYVRQALLSSGLPPSALLLELTESMLIAGTEPVHADLDELRDMGVRLAIDDFGTGYSSLGYLLELPIDVLKVDKTFVTGIADSWRRHALVQGIVRLARTLEAVVIAEGIESMSERELLAAMGCQYGQGYLLSVPVSATEAEALLRRGRNLVPQLPQQLRMPPSHNYLTDL